VINPDGIPYVFMIMPQSSCETDLTLRVLRALGQDGPLFGYCHNCHTEVKFSEDRYVNDRLDEKTGIITQVESGGEIEPRICTFCGAVNLYTPPSPGGDGAMCGVPAGFEMRRVVSVTGGDVPRMVGPELVEQVDFNALVHDLNPITDVFYIQANRSRTPLSRVEWLDYFKMDPAIYLEKERRSCHHAGICVLG
jgi:hypothetical protein